MKKIISLILVFAMGLSLAGCSQPTSGGGVTEEARAVYPKPIKADDYDAQWEVWEQNQVPEAFLAAYNDFGWKTAAELLKNTEESTLSSPLSLYYALALTAEGAEGRTAEQFYDLLGADRDTVQENCGKLFRYLFTDDGQSALTLANSVWMDGEVSVEGQPVSVSFRDDYKKTAAEDYYASLFHCDFTDGNTPKAISNWISDTTKGKLAYEPEVTPESLLAIINTLYFNSPWTDEFEKENTAPDTFTRSDGTEEERDFMHQTNSYFYYKGENYACSSLSLKNGSMHFYLPDAGVTVDDLLSGGNLFREVAEAMEEDSRIREEASENGDDMPLFTDVIWSVPKFDYETTLFPIESLKNLGLTAPFASDEADFSRLCDQPAYVSNIVQGTRIGVDETGVEAAAFTVVMKECGAAPFMERQVVEMNLNRPFLYTINGRNGAVLFVGTYCG